MNGVVGVLRNETFRVKTLSLAELIDQYIVTSCFVIMVLLSALGLIYIKNVNRGLTSSVQMLNIDINNSHIKWSQLLLEKSALESRSRIKAIAKKQFDMVSPVSRKIVYINHE